MAAAALPPSTAGRCRRETREGGKPGWPMSGGGGAAPEVPGPLVKRLCPYPKGSAITACSPSCSPLAPAGAPCRSGCEEQTAGGTGEAAVSPRGLASPRALPAAST